MVVWLFVRLLCGRKHLRVEVVAMNAKQRQGAKYFAQWAMEAGHSALAEALLLGIAASEECERLRGTHEIAPDMTTPAVEQVAAWAAGEIERCHAEGAVFDCVFRCVSEAGSAFDLDAEEIIELAAMRAHVCTDNRETLKNALAECERLREACGKWESAAREADNIIEDKRQHALFGWLAAWSIQWQAQEYHWADAQAFEASEEKVTALEALLSRAAGLLDKASALFLANGKDCGGRLSTEFAEQYAKEFANECLALLAEIGGAK